ncbi:MAG: beta-Ig-H3/fasciclin [Flavobacteriaceae bacterium]|nr:beta-Ig-H3/fasciclin [Flavobacteriaceae bacterium]|tara:strand:+ start:29213 stop:29773 length:561 start_codon:yes stop_codon:yes gene_type:complete
MKKFITFTIIATAAFVFTAFTNSNLSIENDSIKTEAINKDKTIVEIASGNENFTTLVAAVKAAELVETLNGKGPFTVFAPVNDAFAKLPDGTVASLLKPENKETLTTILTYHVVSGKFMAKDVVKAINNNKGTFKIPTVQGGFITASLSGENVILTDAKGNKSTIIMTDVGASNGVIHAIDTVVMP